MRDDPGADSGDEGPVDYSLYDSLYDPDYYKQHPTIEHTIDNSEVNYYISGDGRNQMVSATIYLPSDVVKSKILVCVADNDVSFPAILTHYMSWETTAEERFKNYDSIWSV